MQLNQRQVDIINQLYNQNVALAEGSDDDRRTLTREIAEQIRFEFGPWWGTKASSPTNPQSKDAIAYEDNNAQKLYAWDWQNGDTRKPQVSVGQEGDDLTGQFFIAVNGVNHLGDIPTPPPSSDLESRVAHLESVIASLLTNLSDEKTLLDGTINELDDLTTRVNNLENNKITNPITLARKGDKVTVPGSVIGIKFVLHGTIDQ